MNSRRKRRTSGSLMRRRMAEIERPIPVTPSMEPTLDNESLPLGGSFDLKPPETIHSRVHVHPEEAEAKEKQLHEELFKSEVERFIEISKYFSSPLHKTASYICENRLVSYANPFRIQYKRGGVVTHHMKFSNLILEPVYIKLYKVIPDLEQIKYINMSLSRCKRIPPGLSFTLGFVYDDVNEKPSCNAKMIYVASKKTTTPCYQICEISLLIEPMKIRYD